MTIHSTLRERGENGAAESGWVLCLGRGLERAARWRMSGVGQVVRDENARRTLTLPSFISHQSHPSLPSLVWQSSAWSQQGILPEHSPRLSPPTRVHPQPPTGHHKPQPRHLTNLKKILTCTHSSVTTHLSHSTRPTPNPGPFPTPSQPRSTPTLPFTPQPTLPSLTTNLSSSDITLSATFTRRLSG